MKYPYRHITVLLVLFLAFSCNPQLDSVSLSPRRTAFTFGGGQDSISVNSSGVFVTDCSVDWVTVTSVDNSVVRYSVAVNRSNTLRTTEISVRCGSATQSVLIEQQAPPNNQSKRAFDSLALATLAKECDGANWFLNRDNNTSPWILGRPINEWEGVITQVIDGQLRVVTLNLAGAGVKGDLPASLEDLTALQGLILRQNEISGNVISICSKLDKLIYLDLSRNDSINFDDTPPAGSFKTLGYLDLSVCPLNNPIPQWVLLTNLWELSMAGCGLTGSLPSEMESMSSLTKLDLSDNQLDGKLPRWIASLTKLNYLDLSTCLLEGSLPANIGDLGQLQLLKLGCNSFSGEIPVSLCQIKNLHTLNLNDNELTNLPDALTLLSKLKYFDVSFNNIEGQLIGQWAELTYLDSFIVLGNRLTGAIPDALLNDPRWDEQWYAESLICLQQQDYGFTNNPYQ